MSQLEYFGFNSIINLNNILFNHKPTKIFLVTGKDSYIKSGAKSTIDPILNGYDVTHFNNFETNPKLSDVEKGLKLFREKKCDFVIAIGGGSVIDVAKSINLFAFNDGEPIEYITRKKAIQNRGAPLVAVPTTTGSGSEATKFAVIYTEKIKQSLEHNLMLPDYAIIDPQFALSLPKKVASPPIIDALCQAIESYWSVNSTQESKTYAKQAIKILIKNLPNAINNPNIKLIEELAKVANLAGKAINISRTTAPHAVSYPITAYFDVPHGQAVALTIAQMLIYNSNVTEEDVLDQRGVGYVKRTIKEIVNLLGTKNVEEASTKIKNIMMEMGLSTKLSELGIQTDEDIQLIIGRGFNPDRVYNNPRKLTEDALIKILYEIK